MPCLSFLLFIVTPIGTRYNTINQYTFVLASGRVKVPIPPPIHYTVIATATTTAAIKNKKDKGANDEEDHGKDEADTQDKGTKALHGLVDRGSKTKLHGLMQKGKEDYENK